MDVHAESAGINARRVASGYGSEYGLTLLVSSSRGDHTRFDTLLATMDAPEAKIVYWHRELPPLEAELVAEHTVEATSSRVPGTIAHRDELWDQCYLELMANTERRLTQEVARLGGHFAHVHDESIDPRHDDAAGEAWLHGRFRYMLYRRPLASR